MQNSSIPAIENSNTFGQRCVKHAPENDPRSMKYTCRRYTPVGILRSIFCKMFGLDSPDYNQAAFHDSLKRRWLPQILKRPAPTPNATTRSFRQLNPCPCLQTFYACDRHGQLRRFILLNSGVTALHIPSTFF